MLCNSQDSPAPACTRPFLGASFLFLHKLLDMALPQISPNLQTHLPDLGNVPESLNLTLSHV